MKLKEFTYGDYSYTYDLIQQARKTLSLTVYPNKRIVVKCPSSVGQDCIHHFLKRKYAWLNKQLRFFDRTNRPTHKKEYVSGESFLYLGRQYRLILKQAAENKVSLTKGKMWVFAGRNGHAGKTGEKLLKEWYRDKAEKVLRERFEAVWDTFDYRTKPRLNIRPMKTRWGSCSKKGNVTLNTRLIQAPSHCIDYVIMHELCHLIEHNHSPKYYKLLDRFMPDWKSRKRRLEQHVF
ncbi:MAG: SprT family zinc-dependent metalloprotease [Chlamydiota bacterium]|nr:SprT family zinc-dependent metalloprotease [Chlamydiota bacterium]